MTQQMQMTHNSDKVALCIQQLPNRQFSRIILWFCTGNFKAHNLDHKVDFVLTDVLTHRLKYHHNYTVSLNDFPQQYPN